jgi:hypothetical protein
MQSAVRATFVAAALAVSTATSEAVWVRLVNDSFASNTWTYSGVTNSTGQGLFDYDAAEQRVAATWNQTNLFVGEMDPFTISNSTFSRSLGRTLDDRDTFRFGATLNLTPGSVPDTPEGYQIANVGLYNLSQMGPDRTLTDNWSTNVNLLRDASDFVEFGYFINNNFGGPNVGGTMGAHIDGLDFDYYTGSNYLQTAMGEGHYLPEGVNLYLEVVYYGAATGAVRRQANARVYADAGRTAVLVVNGVTMSYWTLPLPDDRTFTLTDVAFQNYVAGLFHPLNTPGGGAGWLDDVYVDVHRDPGQIDASTLAAGAQGIAITWASEAGTNYYVVSTTNLATGPWVTDAVVQATGELTSWTGSVSAAGRTYGVRH